MNQRKKKVEEALGNLFSSTRKTAVKKESVPQSAATEPVNEKRKVPVEQQSTHPDISPQKAPPAAVKSLSSVPPAIEADSQPPSDFLPATAIPPQTALNMNHPKETEANSYKKEQPLVTDLGVESKPPSSAPVPQVGSGNGKGTHINPIETESEEIRQLVVFNLAEEMFGLPIERVESIIKTQSITVVPHARPYVVGVTNLRGTVLPVIDLRRRFNYPPVESDEQQRIVVVSYHDEKIGLRVDAISQVLSVPVRAIEPPPPLVMASIEAGYITAIAKVAEKLVILLDLDKVLSE